MPLRVLAQRNYVWHTVFIIFRLTQGRTGLTGVWRAIGQQKVTSQLLSHRLAFGLAG